MIRSNRTNAVLVPAFAAFFVLASVGGTFVRAPLKPAAERKPAASFALQDLTGKTVKLEDYRGRIVLLDFWATWCTGCKQEIPWFAAFQQQLGDKGFAVVGVSLDEGGWKVLKPFLEAHPVPYTRVLGDKATPARYGITGMPDTFLIDRQGRVAAASQGLVDRANIEANIQALIRE